ncbi:PaaI family thioesterase [Cumulibacter soli]|uniref:PaaI family thioesterase n=1 Tax=Cumulibacter soli TaxID=2546344 RepID=UPI001067F0DB|nr:PaaI family thioesterase [Cumulibacter soli]
METTADPSTTDFFSSGVDIAEGEWAGWTTHPGGDPFEDHTGPFYHRVVDGEAVCAFRVEKKQLNGGNALHGGCFMTFADFSLFVIGRPALIGQRAVTATFNCELVGAATEGQLVEARGEIIKDTRSMVFIRGTLTADGETIMSYSSALKKIGARKPN